MPSGHGKGGHVLIQETTIARHFSTMRQFQEHLGKRLADQGIFEGIEHKVVESPRWPWTEEAVDSLLRARWNPGCRDGNRISEETRAWLVAIGGYIGTRVEEIARLHPADVLAIDDVYCFIIRARSAKAPAPNTPLNKIAAPAHSMASWMTRTPTGERAIPIRFSRKFR